MDDSTTVNAGAVNGYVILVRFSAHAAQAEAFFRRMADFSAYMHAQQGCLRYDLARDPKDLNEFLLYEVFSDEAAWSAHHDKPAMAALMADIRPMLAGKPDRTIWDRLVG